MSSRRRKMMMLRMVLLRGGGGRWWCWGWSCWGPRRDPHFVRTSAIQKARQYFTRTILYRNWQEKCRGPEPRRTLCASLRSRNAHQHFTRATLYGNLQEKCRDPEPRRTLCASLRSRNAHQHFTIATLYIRKFTRKMPRPRTAAHTLCEPAQSKCASTCHKSNFVRNLREKCHGPAGAPWSSTSLYNYRKNASVWKHCLGKKHILVG